MARLKFVVRFFRRNLIGFWELQNSSVAAIVKPTASFIFLHGLGDTGVRWTTMLRTFWNGSLPYVNIRCPTAHAIPVTMNGGLTMPAWFDIKGITAAAFEDVAGIREATRLVHEIVDEEIASGIAADRIAIGGFSQGGALALNAAFTYPKRLAAVVALSTWLPLTTFFTPNQVVANRNMPVLQCHGQIDNIVPVGFGHLTAIAIRSLTNDSQFKTYFGLMHAVSPFEMMDVLNFVKLRIPEDSKA